MSQLRRLKRAGRRKNIGPTQETRRIVFERDEGRCVRCGRHVTNWIYSIQHRRARGMGGSKDPSINRADNLILLCGDGVQGCHGWVETHREQSHDNGWSLPWWQSADTYPVTYWDGKTYTLTPQGDRNHG